MGVLSMKLKSLTFLSLGLLALLVAVPAISTLSAQEAETAPKSKTIQELRGRLPNHWGDVVTTDQRKKIYEIQHSYDAEIKKLEDQIAKLEADMEQEVKSVLTDAQLSRIKELIAEEELRREKNEAAKAAAKKLLSESES